jgi:hypothetical protein
MPRARMGDEAKKLHGSYKPSRGDAVRTHGSVALVGPLPAPDDLDPAARHEWDIHMLQCVAAGSLSSANLIAFRALAEAAVLRGRAYRRALKEPPVRSTAAGGTKPNAVWTLFLAADANYRNWCFAFGLVPKGTLPRLPVPGTAPLQAV